MVLATAAVTFVACAKEIHENTDTVSGPGEELTIGAAAGTFTKVNFAEEGGELKVRWNSADEAFTAFIAGSAQRFDQASAPNENGKAYFSGETPQDATGESTFYAFYPAVAGGEQTAVALDFTSQTGTAPDQSLTYMYGAGTLASVQAEGLTFSHLTSILKITLSVKNAKGAAVSGTATNVTFSSENLVTNAAVNLTSATVAAAGTATGNIVLTGEFPLDGEGKTTVYLHTLPAGLEGTSVSVKVGENTYSGVIPARSEGTGDMVVGKMYTVPVTVEESVYFELNSYERSYAKEGWSGNAFTVINYNVEWEAVSEDETLVKAKRASSGMVHLDVYPNPYFNNNKKVNILIRPIAEELQTEENIVRHVVSWTGTALNPDKNSSKYSIDENGVLTLSTDSANNTRFVSFKVGHYGTYIWEFDSVNINDGSNFQVQITRGITGSSSATENVAATIYPSYFITLQPAKFVVSSSGKYLVSKLNENEFLDLYNGGFGYTNKTIGELTELKCTIEPSTVPGYINIQFYWNGSAWFGKNGTDTSHFKDVWTHYPDTMFDMYMGLMKGTDDVSTVKIKSFHYIPYSAE